MHGTRTVLLSLLLAPGVAAQDLWQANRFSKDLHRVNTCGEVVQRVDLSANGFNLRSVHQAPDGKLWVVNFITTTFTILDSKGGSLKNVKTTGGRPFQVAFDKAGHAWITMTGTNTVQEFDAAGKLLSTSMVAANPLGIAIDVDGNKWIAHRSGPPGSVSRIDGTTGNVTNHAMPATSKILPTKIAADFRGLGKKSHVWVIGDTRGRAELIELDSAGKVLNLYPIGPSTGGFSSLVIDANNDIWIGDFRNGNLFQVDSSNGKLKNNTPIVNSPNILGLTLDGFGDLWVTTRVGFRSPPSELRRYNRGALRFEVAATVGGGAGSPAASRWQYVRVTDPLGDLDKDGDPNFTEIAAGTSPFEPCSNRTTSLSIEGSTKIGSKITVRVRTGAGFVTGIGFALKTTSPGLTIPGVGCALLLDLASLAPSTVTLNGPSSFTGTLPNNPSAAGVVLRMQALTLAAPAPQFSNVICAKIFK